MPRFWQALQRERDTVLAVALVCACASAAVQSVLLYRCRRPVERPNGNGRGVRVPPPPHLPTSPKEWRDAFEQSFYEEFGRRMDEPLPQHRPAPPRRSNHGAPPPAEWRQSMRNAGTPFSPQWPPYDEPEPPRVPDEEIQEIAASEAEDHDEDTDSTDES